MHLTMIQIMDQYFQLDLMLHVPFLHYIEQDVIIVWKMFLENHLNLYLLQNYEKYHWISWKSLEIC